MNVLLNIVLPIFALIGAGWLARRRQWLGEAGATELNRFVVYIAMPALLFRIMATAKWHDLNQPGFTAAFTLGAGVIFALTLVARRMRGEDLGAAALDGLNAGYANVGFIGFPLCLAAFGPGSLTFVTITAIVTVCVLFAAAVIFMELNGPGNDGWNILRKVSMSVIMNPMVLAPLLGVGYAALFPDIPVGADHFLKYLADAASPCALVSLGAFIGQSQGAAPRTRVSALVTLKLLAQPAVTWVLAHGAFHLAPASTAVAVVIAALPTGTGPYMLANMYQKDGLVTARTVLMSTLASIVTISALITVFGTNG